MEAKKESELEKAWGEEIERENEKSNPIGKLLLYAGWVIFGVSILLTILVDFGYFTGILGGLMIAGFGEIIGLLQKIYVNTKRGTSS